MYRCWLGLFDESKLLGSFNEKLRHQLGGKKVGGAALEALDKNTSSFT